MEEEMSCLLTSECFLHKETHLAPAISKSRDEEQSQAVEVARGKVAPSVRGLDEQAVPKVEGEVGHQHQPGERAKEGSTQVRHQGEMGSQCPRGRLGRPESPP